MWMQEWIDERFGVPNTVNIQVYKDFAREVEMRWEKLVIFCPFCGENDFDKIGLKWHIETYCEVYRETEALL